MSEPAEGARLIPGKEIAVSEKQFPNSDRPSGTALLSSSHASTNPVSHWTLEITIYINVINGVAIAVAIVVVIVVVIITV